MQPKQDRLIITPAKRLLVGASLLFCVSAMGWTGQVMANSNVLKIAAPANVYAYIYRPIHIDPASTATIETRMKVGPSSGDSWTPSIFLYWDQTRYAALGQLSDGVLRTNHFAIKLSTRKAMGLKPGEWVTLRINLSPTLMQLELLQPTGAWERVAYIQRPADMKGSPVELMLGKGFENDTTSPHTKPMNSSTTGPGDLGVSWYSHLRITVDGKDVFYDDFQDLAAWKTRSDPAFAETISITTTQPPNASDEVHGSALRPTDLRWDAQVATIEQRYASFDKSKGTIVFIGDSNIRGWSTLAQDFPDLPVINAGVGGSQIIDAVYYADRIVIPFQPHTVLLRAGGNDLTAQKLPQQLFADYKAFVAKVHAALPKTRIIYLGMQLSDRRLTQEASIKEANRLIQEYTQTDPRLEFIDIYPKMLASNGKPNAKLFLEDGLHVSAKGYQVWIEAIQPYLTRK